MRNKLLASTAALLAGIAIASAQETPSGGQSGSAAQTQHQQSREGQAQRGPDRSKQGQRDEGMQGKQGQSQRSPGREQRDQTTGQSEQSKQGQRDQGKQGKQDQSQRSQGREQRDQTTGQAPAQREQSKQGQRDQGIQSQGKQSQSKPRGESQRDQTTGQSQRSQSPSPAQSQGGQRDQTQGQAPQRQQAQPQQNQQGQAQQGQVQQGQAQQGQAGGSVTLTAEQRTKIRETVLAGRNVPRVNNVSFSISVGTRVPRSVRVVAVPETLIAIHPEWRGHRYFVIRDDIVIVDRDYSIVAVVPTGSSGGEAARLADGGGTLNLSSDEIREVQIALKAKGFDVELDGVLGTRTRRALIEFQRRQGFQASGRIDNRTVTALGVSSKIGQQGNGSGSQPSTTGQNKDNMQKSPADQKQGAGAQGDQGGSTTGQGNDKMQKSPADQKQGAGAQGNESGSQPSTTGQGDDKMQKSPADQKQGGSQSSTTGQGSDKMQKSPADAGQAPQNKNPDGSNK